LPQASFVTITEKKPFVMIITGILYTLNKLFQKT